MSVRLSSFVPALAATAVLGFTASGASGATLFTTASHTTRVTTGSTATITGSDITLTAFSATAGSCPHSALDVRLTQNDMTSGVVFETISGTFNNCNGYLNPSPATFPWTLTIFGSSTLSGTSSCWPSRWDGVRYDLAGFVYTGDLISMKSCQPVIGGSPVTIDLNGSGTLVGPLYPLGGAVSGKYVFTGTAAGWSLTN